MQMQNKIPNYVSRNFDDKIYTLKSIISGFWIYSTKSSDILNMLFLKYWFDIYFYKVYSFIYILIPFFCVLFEIHVNAMTERLYIENKCIYSVFFSNRNFIDFHSCFNIFISTYIAIYFIFPSMYTYIYLK